MPTTKLPNGLRLPEEDEVHVWIAHLPVARPHLPALEAPLSTEERQRAGRFVQADDRARYVAAHGILRQLLGGYLSTAPSELEFFLNPFGKPALKPVAGKSTLTFNLSHSGDVILCAMAQSGRVGVDVEVVRTGLDVIETARSQFSPEEIRKLQAFEPSEQTGAFFRCWTRKEACVKARGEGLSFPLKQFSVSFGRDEVPSVRWAANDAASTGQWSMFDLVPGPGYAGAVVMEGGPVRLLVRTWESPG